MKKIERIARGLTKYGNCDCDDCRREVRAKEEGIGEGLELALKRLIAERNELRLSWGALEERATNLELELESERRWAAEYQAKACRYEMALRCIAEDVNGWTADYDAMEHRAIAREALDDRG